MTMGLIVNSVSIDGYLQGWRNDLNQFCLYYEEDLWPDALRERITFIQNLLDSNVPISPFLLQDDKGVLMSRCLSHKSTFYRAIQSKLKYQGHDAQINQEAMTGFKWLFRSDYEFEMLLQVAHLSRFLDSRTYQHLGYYQRRKFSKSLDKLTKDLEKISSQHQYLFRNFSQYINQMQAIWQSDLVYEDYGLEQLDADLNTFFRDNNVLLSGLMEDLFSVQEQLDGVTESMVLESERNSVCSSQASSPAGTSKTHAVRSHDTSSHRLSIHQSVEGDDCHGQRSGQDQTNHVNLFGKTHHDPSKPPVIDPKTASVKRSLSHLFETESESQWTDLYPESSVSSSANLTQMTYAAYAESLGEGGSNKSSLSDIKDMVDVRLDDEYAKKEKRFRMRQSLTDNVQKLSAMGKQVMPKMKSNGLNHGSISSWLSKKSSTNMVDLGDIKSIHFAKLLKESNPDRVLATLNALVRVFSESHEHLCERTDHLRNQLMPQLKGFVQLIHTFQRDCVGYQKKARDTAALDQSLGVYLVFSNQLRETLDGYRMYHVDKNHYWQEVMLKVITPVDKRERERWTSCVKCIEHTPFVYAQAHQAQQESYSHTRSTLWRKTLGYIGFGLCTILGLTIGLVACIVGFPVFNLAIAICAVVVTGSSIASLYQWHRVHQQVSDMLINHYVTNHLKPDEVQQNVRSLSESVSSRRLPSSDYEYSPNQLGGTGVSPS